MSVILANASLAVEKKTHAWTRDAHGIPIAAGAARTTTAFAPGAIRESPDINSPQGIEWTLRVDPQLWPVKNGDVVIEESGPRRWVVTQARLAKNVMGYDAVDHVAITAVLETPDTP